MKNILDSKIIEERIEKHYFQAEQILGLVNLTVQVKQ